MAAVIYRRGRRAERPQGGSGGRAGLPGVGEALVGGAARPAGAGDGRTPAGDRRPTFGDFGASNA